MADALAHEIVSLAPLGGTTPRWISDLIQARLALRELINLVIVARELNDRRPDPKLKKALDALGKAVIVGLLRLPD